MPLQTQINLSCSQYLCSDQLQFLFKFNSNFSENVCIYIQEYAFRMFLVKTYSSNRFISTFKDMLDGA